MTLIVVPIARVLYLSCFLFFVGALSDILDAFVISENAARMRAARESAGNDMLKMMQIVFPIAVQIQMDVLAKYGFLLMEVNNLYIYRYLVNLLFLCA